MRLLLATSNPRKIEDFNRTLGRFGIPFDTVPYDEPEPQAENSESVSRWKAIYAFRRYRRPVIATDFCVHFDALNGFPGPGLKLVHHQLGLDGLLKTLRKLDAGGKTIVGHEGYSCRFVTAISYMDEKLDEARTFRRITPGVLDPGLYVRLGLTPKDWLDRLFKPDDAACPLGLMTTAQFEAWRSTPENEQAYAELSQWIARQRPDLRQAKPPTER